MPAASHLDLNQDEALDRLVDVATRQHEQILELREQLAHQNSAFQKPEIPQLMGRSNYDNWRVSIESHLQSLGVLKYVRDPVPEPEREDRFAAWSRERATCYSAIWNTTLPVHEGLEFRGYIFGTDPYTLWAAIKADMEPEPWDSTEAIVRTINRRDVLDRRLYATMGDMLNVFQFIQDSTGFDIEEYLLADSLLNACRFTHEDIYQRYSAILPGNLALIMADLEAIREAEDSPI